MDGDTGDREPRPDLDKAARWAIAPVLREVLDKLSLNDEDRTRPRLVLTALRALGYKVVRGAALADAHTENARLRAAVERVVAVCDGADDQHDYVTAEVDTDVIRAALTDTDGTTRELRKAARALAAAPAPAEDEEGVK